MKNKKKLVGIAILAIIIIAIIIIIFYTTKKNQNNNDVEIKTESTDLNVEYINKELTGEWADCKAKIILSDETVSIEGNGVTNNENTIIINTAGTYYLTGNISNGNILIKAGDKDDVQLVLDNVSITSQTTAPINGITSGNLTITLADNSINTITDSSTYSIFTDTTNQEPNGAVFTKSDLIINGNGKLVVNSNYQDGIVSKDELKIINTTIEVNSQDDAIRGKDYVAIKDANINITSKGDGIKSTNTTDTTLGYIAIEGGDITINSELDGIQAETVLNISSDAKIDIITNGEITSSNSNQNFDNRGRPMEIQETAEDTKSSKGIKAGTEIAIESGDINISSTDDSIHSNGIIIIEDGTINTSSEDDGIHADTNIVINNGKINIAKSYEGIESSYIEINGGIISVTASDDGMNVAGGNDSSAMGDRRGQNNFSAVGETNQKLVINNGDITVEASGDGLDANGSININGGTTKVAGPTNGGNGALDYYNECVVTGGTFIIYGSIEMWQNPSNTSTQYSLTFQANGNIGDEIVLKDNYGNEIVSVSAVKTYQAITISAPNIEAGDTYNLYINGENVSSIEANSIVSTNFSSGGMNNMQMQPIEPGNGRQPMR